MECSTFSFLPPSAKAKEAILEYFVTLIKKPYILSLSQLVVSVCKVTLLTNRTLFGHLEMLAGLSLVEIVDHGVCHWLLRRRHLTEAIWIHHHAWIHHVLLVGLQRKP
jgi:hypothetical protein